MLRLTQITAVMREGISQPPLAGIAAKGTQKGGAMTTEAIRDVAEKLAGCLEVSGYFHTKSSLVNLFTNWLEYHHQEIHEATADPDGCNCSCYDSGREVGYEEGRTS